MASKDDSFLNTGVSTAVSRKNVEKRTEAQEEAKRTKAQLLPAAERLLAKCDKELAGIYDMRTIFVNLNSTEADIKAERLGRAMHDKFVTSFKREIEQILKETVAK